MVTVKEVASLMEGGMVMLWRRPVYWRENGQVREVSSLMEREWSCYRGGHLNIGRMIMLQVSSD